MCSSDLPKIADYPFTTIKPQLGVVAIDGEEFVVADLPGLIEGAHEGRGLGHRFLGHVERCGAILHLVDGTQDNVAAAYRTVRRELIAYGHGLDEKLEIIGLNKVDALTPAVIKTKRAALVRAAKELSPGAKVMALSGVAGTGVHRRYLLDAVFDHQFAHACRGRRDFGAATVGQRLWPDVAVRLEHGEFDLRHLERRDACHGGLKRLASPPQRRHDHMVWHQSPPSLRFLSGGEHTTAIDPTVPRPRMGRKS